MSNVTSNFLAYALIISVCWGAIPVLYKYVLTDVSPKYMIFVTAIINCTFVVAYTLLNWDDIYTNRGNTNLRNIVLLAVAILVGTTLPNYIYYPLLRENSAYFTTIITFALPPIITLVVAAIFLKEKITASTIIGTILVIAGLIIILGYETPSLHQVVLKQPVVQPVVISDK